MSYRTYFAFATGLAKTVTVPIHTTAAMIEHVAKVEKQLGLVTERYLENQPHWTSASKEFSGVSDKIVCAEVEAHNGVVRRFYEVLSDCTAAPPIGQTEELTPETAATFWHGLELLEVPVERWTADYYRARMDTLYEVMRGRETAGVSFDAEALTAQQAGEVITLFSEFLDAHDIRLEVPRGYDELKSSDEYAWCATCGAVSPYEPCEHIADEDDDDDIEDLTHV